ncbi:MAG: hypothetical protein A2X82_08980 [Geobacteraceae bacterium GWC2_55_20]|nr:MAG: hypothetical protein A2X82_08980 [Geobacteraceae bacterium GWC2_55_20]
MKILDRIFSKKPDTVVVPPDHKIVVVHPAKTPYFGRGASGMWIADFGDGTEDLDLFDTIRQIVQSGDKANVILIFQPSFIDHASNAESILSNIQELKLIDCGILSKIAVIPFATAQHLPFVAKLREFGIEVHHSADDGACFVEVFKTDGIVIGMPGKPFR